MRKGSGSGPLGGVGGASGLPVKDFPAGLVRVRKGKSDLSGGSEFGETVKTVNV